MGGGAPRRVYTGYVCMCDLKQGIPKKGEGLRICEEGPQEAGRNSVYT